MVLKLEHLKATDWPISEKKICLGQFEQQNIKQSYWVEQYKTIKGSSWTGNCVISTHKLASLPFHSTSGL
ncbi:MAG: hypothetical protein R3E90_02515 [Marinicella sp.]